MRFDRAYVQSPFCGPSRMSYYTGRYCHSHGSTWNGFPLRVGEPTLGDHLRPLGVRAALVGKTHMKPDTKGMEWLGIDPGSTIGVLLSECGFEPFERDDGLHPDGPYDPAPAYDNYLRQHGFRGRNPWEEWANSAEGDDGEILSGWLMRYGNLPARVPDEHSETPYMTQRAIDFMQTGGRSALALPPVLHQAALALYRAGAVSQHVRARTHPAAGALGSRTADRPPGLCRLSEEPRLPRLLAR